MVAPQPRQRKGTEGVFVSSWGDNCLIVVVAMFLLTDRVVFINGGSLQFCSCTSVIGNERVVGSFVWGLSGVFKGV